MKIYKKILSLEESQARDTVCYSIGSLCSSAASMIVLLIVTRIMGAELSGAFSLAWSAAQLMLTIGWFSTRQYQVSDVKEEIGFREYCAMKMCSSMLMVILGAAYVKIYHYDSITTKMTILLCLFMITDVFADFFSGYFQHINKLYIGGISYAVRTVGYVSVLTIVLLTSKSLEMAILSVTVYVTIWLMLFDVKLVKMVPKKNLNLRRKNVVRLYIDCFPLFIGSFVTTFIMNIPKNAINKYMEASIQTSYNILFMPTSVINLCSMFLCVPFYGKLASLWMEENKDEFSKNLFKIGGLLVAMTIAILIGGITLGIPVLSWLYGVDLHLYRSAFMILLLGGGCYGLISLLAYVITVFRKQRVLLYVYLIGAVGAQFLVNPLVKVYGMMGAAMTYTITLIIICSILMAYIVYYLRKVEKKRGCERR